MTNSVEQPSLQQVKIKYQSQNDENLPISGMATCVFAVPEARSDRLLEATINSQSLTEAVLAALDRAFLVSLILFCRAEIVE